MAPEVVQSKGYNKSVDWYALGVLIFEMLVSAAKALDTASHSIRQAGYPPFFTEDGNPMKLYEKVGVNSPPASRHLTYRSSLAKCAIPPILMSWPRSCSRTYWLETSPNDMVICVLDHRTSSHTLGLQRWTGTNYTDGRSPRRMSPKSKVMETPASKSFLAFLFRLMQYRFDRYQEADVSEYGRAGTGPYDHFFTEF